MWAAATQVPYGGGLVVSTAGTIVAGLVVTLVSTVVGFSVHKVRQGIEDMKDTASKNATAIANVSTQVDKLVVVIAGEEPSPMNPRPVPGLATAVMGPGGLIETVKTHGDMFVSQGKQLLEQGKQISALLKDSKPDDGHSSRDVIDRIESQTA
jgi:hypothetical protein